MSDAKPTPPTSTPPTPTPPPPAADVEDGKGGKSAVLADLATERDKRQALETQVRELQEAQTKQTDALAKAFGLKPEETSDSTLAAEVLALKEQFATTTHTNTVLSVATEHGISDKDDIAILMDAKDEAAIRRLAERIQKAGENTSRTPKPDLTQGGKGGNGQGGSPEKDFEAFMGAQLGQ